MKIDELKSVPNLPELETKVLDFWEKENIFEKSLKLRESGELFNFYDGPPFANGLPHYGHILAMSIKDLFVRFKTMQGYSVPRINGWDTHGLPVEYAIEKELGLKGKKEILKYGIDKFNLKARESVFRYVDVWTETMKRMGRWIDFENAYSTLDPDYIESVWWVLKQIHEAGLLTKDTKTQAYCPRCETPLSNFEVNQGYKEIKDVSIFVKVKLSDSDQSALIWTTTPWTLAGNRAIAISKNLEYVEVEVEGDRLIVGADFAKRQGWDGGQRIITENLIEKSYEPLYPPKNQNPNDFKIYYADFVTAEEGTGFVHIAPTFGEDDSVLGKAQKLTNENTVDGSGTVLAGPGIGRFVKDADEDVLADLEERKILFKKEQITHTYPFCWRCDTPLIYYSTPAWLVEVSSLREKIVSNNEKTNWVPAHLKTGRFGKWLAGAKDWTISRNRFWGAPLPIWIGEKSNKVIVIGSRQELVERGVDPGQLKELHRPEIDNITFEENGETYARVPEVFDCWFESGSMPYAQLHFPFENKDDFTKRFPADFIAEGLDQTRGWFYTLHVLATILSPKILGSDGPAFKNVVVNGLILAPDGQKLSKRLRNYPEPETVFNTLGVDALRQYLYSSSSIGEDYRFSEELVKEEVRKVILPLWNCFVFLKQNFPAAEASDKSEQLIDRWIIARVNETGQIVTKAFDDYELTLGTRKYEELITDLSVWYLRRSKKRTDADFASTLAFVIRQIILMIAPAMPFISEIIYQQLKSSGEPESIHLVDWPKFASPDSDTIKKMKQARGIVEELLRKRAENNIKVRQPLALAKFPNLGADYAELILSEINVKAHETSEEVWLDTDITPELKEEGELRDLIRAIQSARKSAGLVRNELVNAEIYVSSETNERLVRWQSQLEEATATKLNFTKTQIEGEKLKYGSLELVIKFK